jgi:putative two-component system response regulator
VPVLQLGREIALTHHERWDGSGYPHGLKGEQIPLSGRIVTVADVFDALIHDRPYKHAWPIERAVAEITAQQGHQFDPEVVDAFLRLLERGALPAAATGAHPKPTAQVRRTQP